MLKMDYKDCMNEKKIIAKLGRKLEKKRGALVKLNCLFRCFLFQKRIFMIEHLKPFLV